MKRYVIAFIAGILLVMVAFYLYVRSGSAPSSVSTSLLPIEHFFSRLEADIIPPNKLPKKYAGPPSEAELLAGAHTYRENCALCHGLPSESRTVIARGLSPRPPEFFRPEDGTAYNSSLPFKPATQKVYRKVKYGVSHSGMPSFESGLNDNQIWELSQFLSNARNLPPSVIAVLEAEPGRPKTSSSASKMHPQIASKDK